MAADALKLGASSPGRAAATRADLVVRGGTIHTAATRLARASALAVQGGRILAVGGDDAIAAWIGPATRVLDLHGLTVLPGLIDSHAHVLGLGGTLEQVRLAGTKSYAEVIDAVKARARTAPPGEWIQGRGWDQNHWPGKTYPRHAALSAAVPDHPVALRVKEALQDEAVSPGAHARAAARVQPDVHRVRTDPRV